MARDLKVYTRDEITARLAGHPAWRLGDDGQLHADFTFKNFMPSISIRAAIL